MCNWCEGIYATGYGGYYMVMMTTISLGCHIYHLQNNKMQEMTIYTVYRVFNARV